VYPDYFAELYGASQAKDVGLSFAEFAETLLSLGRAHLSPGAARHQALAFYRTLHLRDLALARACCLGIDVAWEYFIHRYRERLYAAALVLARNESIARELADSIAGDLFDSAAEIRSSKLASYAGRGSLDGWLKAVLTHAYIDQYRCERRVVSLDCHRDFLNAICIGDGVARAADPRLNEAMEEACRERSPEERFLLSSYFFDRRTLAEIGGMLGVHESTISRRMDRLLRGLRMGITRNLRAKGMSRRQIDELLRADVQTLNLDLRGELL
jgi:RNA polymerase sigma-70 factor (ECF subfamily)